MNELPVKTGVLMVGFQLLIALGPLSAQTNIETNAPGVQLNFSTPGARSLAMGGTFLGRADDATAAYANPAGLVNLPQAEASLEVRAWEYTHVFTDRGRGEFRQDGSLAGLVDGSATDQVSGASFASFVYPKGRWAVAVYFHSLADFEANFTTGGAVVVDFNGDRGRLFPVRTGNRLEISNSGASVAYRLSEDLSVGIGLSRYDFSIDSRLERCSGSIDEAIDLGTCTLENTQTQEGNDSDLGATIGFLWRIAPRWQIGGAFRQGPSFAFRAQNRPGGGDATSPALDATFHVPEIWGLGAMWQASERLTVGFDYYRIGYSVFAEDFTDVFETGTEVDFAADDGSEVHVGLEYSFLNGARPWFLRSGAWWDPAHGVRYVGDPVDEDGEVDTFGVLDLAAFRSRRGAVHWAVGGGAVGNSYQVDAGIDFSERTWTLSVSTVVRF